jgi:rhamnose transport system substrate-binding protein
MPPRDPQGRLTAHRSEIVLAALLLVEIAVFAALGSNFLTAGNAGEIARASAEVSLLALALTPVILTGGIDLSVGSLLGLSAVVLGATWRDAGLPIGVAALAAVTVGFAGGGLNALLIARLGIPPLIVTLGSYSLFRGVAEGMTGGIVNYSKFPESFLVLGQGRVAGVPTQLLIAIVAAVLCWALVHTTTIGRTLRAIGFSSAGAAHAGVPVARRLALVYLLSGLASGVAALVYVSRLGQAKADAGTGFELMAITAVVLGGTSIFGGRGSVVGTLLGVAVLAVLQNGARLSDLPAELAGVLAGVLLVTAIGVSRWSTRASEAG